MELVENCSPFVNVDLVGFIARLFRDFSRPREQGVGQPKLNPTGTMGVKSRMPPCGFELQVLVRTVAHRATKLKTTLVFQGGLTRTVLPPPPERVVRARAVRRLSC